METPQIHGTKEVAASVSLLRRIWKYKLHYMIVLPALLLIFFFKIFPLIAGMVMAFKDFRVFRGLIGSPWVGIANFSQLFARPEFRNALANTLIIKLEYVAVIGIIALVVALAVSSLNSGKWKSWIKTLVLVPYFIPSVVVAYVLYHMLGPSQLEKLHLHLFILGDPRFFRPMLVIVESIKTCAIPILIALAAIESKHAALPPRSSYLYSHIIPASRAISAFALLQLSTILSTDPELVGNLYNPLVYQVADTLDTYSFRSGLMAGNYSEASALGVFQFLIQFIGTLAAYLFIRSLLYRDLFNSYQDAEHINTESSKRNVIGIAFSIICSFGILLLIYYICIYPFTIQSPFGISLRNVLPINRYVDYSLINITAVIVNALITLTLAYPLTVKDLPGHNVYKLILLVVIAAGTGSISEFLMFKSLGMINTVYPQLISGFFTILNAFVLKSIFNSKYARIKEQAALAGRGELHSFFTLFIPKVWKPLIALGVLQYVFLSNSYNVSFLYIAKPSMVSPIMTFKTLAFGANQMGVQHGDPVILQLAAVITIPSLVLLLIFRKWLTSEVLISQIRKL